MSLPIIDILPYLEDNHSPSNEARRREVAAKIHNACVDYGFFYLDISSYVDPREPEELTTLARQFFSLPQEEKDKIALKNEDQARGYARLKENVTNGKADNHEGIDWYRPVEKPDKTKPLWGENQWPTVPTFREKYENWVDKMKALGLIVMGAMADGLGMTSEEREDLCRQVDDSFWVMRAIGYPSLPNDHDGFSCGAHKDYGCLTFLYTDPTPAALQVFTHNVDVGSDVSDLPAEQGTQAGSWISADPIPGCVVCNIGEMWEIWTNGLYKSTLHRVVHRSKNYRVSIPFFFEPNFNARIEPLAAALRIQADKPNPGGKEYKSVVYGDFLLNKVGNNFADGKGKY
ncbi:hypothetical protein EV421DRAFT_824592 [Armillaria borealis]|uniref:Fe2OG dioxygenase domain-containing protein n=1 Tax=Armillaria borealis TaxID=47425 RepID=A0AA39MNE0_9AGAR|nr:hypothetical protein EV421DRAFT_824592 [Armillaria borealis]